MAMSGNMLIVQSGGPTAVINQSLAGAILEARKQPAIQAIYGAAHGLKGVLEERFIDLRRETKATLEAVAATPAAALGSARKKPTPEECVRVFDILKRHAIRYFFYIGGNDSAESAHLIAENAGRAGYPVACWHIPKTIDNDLRGKRPHARFWKRGAVRGPGPDGRYAGLPGPAGCEDRRHHGPPCRVPDRGFRAGPHAAR